MQQNMKGHDVDFNDFYTQLAEHLVQDQLLINQQLTNIRSTKRQTQEELFRRVSLAREYIQYNFTQKISIEELAAISSLSKYHFLRVFKELFRCTPYQLILKLKLNNAEKLINKGYSYAQACEQVGFSDPKNLRKALKKIGN
jgi:AraC-like DNA-binding protein